MAQEMTPDDALWNAVMALANDLEQQGKPVMARWLRSVARHLET